MKRCSRCKEFKSADHFHRDSGRQDGLNHRCKPCNTIHQKARYNKKKSLDPVGFREKGRAYELKHHYGITADQYAFLLEKQNGRCAVCEREPHQCKRKYLFVDHDHTTGVVRGLLCGTCNSAIGLLKDNKSLLENAILYLETQNRGLAINSNAKGRLRVGEPRKPLMVA